MSTQFFIRIEKRSKTCTDPTCSGELVEYFDSNDISEENADEILNHIIPFTENEVSA